MRAQRTDGIHADTIRELAKIGARAKYIGDPVDLLVAYRGVWVVLELKDGRKPSSKRKLTPREREAIDTYPAPIHVVLSADEAVRVVVEAARPRGG